ncbi:MAG: hypothetical protein AABX53_03585 [Nanoarchaeota archaeon]
MVKKDRIELYTDSLSRIAGDFMRDMSGWAGVRQPYDSFVSEHGYNLMPAYASRGPEVRLRIIGSGLGNNVPESVMNLTRNACYAACKSFGIPLTNISIVGKPCGIDLERLRGELTLEAQLDTPLQMRYPLHIDEIEDRIAEEEDRDD